MDYLYLMDGKTRLLNPIPIYSISRHTLFRLKRVVDRSKFVEECIEPQKRLLQIFSAAHFTDRVHAQLRQTYIEGANTTACRQDRTDGATTALVLANDELLKWNVVAASQLLHDERSFSRGRVSLVCVVLNYWTFVKLWTVVLFMLFGVVWMYSMSHISRNHETLAARLRVKKVILGNTLHDGFNQVTTSTHTRV